MYRAVSTLAALTLALMPGSALEPSAGARREVTNPILWADVPDASVIRVGDNYYMSSTTMHMSPGLPIMKSRDLVNWRIVSYAYQTLGDNDALNLENGKSAYGQGSWASSLRYHDGVFFVSTFSHTTGKNHVYRTKDIERGPWQETSFRPALHDHSLFFDDGRVYMVHGSGTIRLTELTPDVSGIKPGGVDQVIIPDAGRVAGSTGGLPAEGSQLFKVNGRYYLFMIVWPRGSMRTQLVYRADRLEGPWEGRIALQDQGVAQGGIVDTPGGEWYALLFQDHGAVGRTPFLVPAKWVDGWPILGLDGRLDPNLKVKASQPEMPAIVASDEFSRRPGDRLLPLVWQWNHNPDNDLWSLTERPGYLRLRTGRDHADMLSARNMLTQRTFGPQCSGAIAMDVSRMKDGDRAGLCLLQKRYGFVGVKVEGNSKSIVVVNAETGIPEEAQNIPVGQDTVFLRADCDFKERIDQATFYYSLNGRNWTVIGKPMKMVYTLPHFMGYRFGLVNFATTTTGGSVDIDYFRIRPSLARVNR